MEKYNVKDAWDIVSLFEKKLAARGFDLKNVFAQTEIYYLEDYYHRFTQIELVRNFILIKIWQKYPIH